MVELCQLNTVTPSSPGTFTCTTPALQQNIVRGGISLAQISKPQPDYHSFKASLNTPPVSATSFTISVAVTLPVNGMRLSYFLIIIKSQPKKVYIDLVVYNWGTGTSVDNNDDWDRTVTQTFDLTSKTLFSTIPTGLASYPLTTSFKMLSPSLDKTKKIQFQLSSSISGVNLYVSLVANSKTKISTFQGIVLVYSTANLATDNTTFSWNSSMFINKWDDPNNYNMTAFASAFGPSFASKCIFGYSKITYKGDKTIDWKFTLTPTYNNFYSVDFPNDSNDFNPAGCFFCFGNGTDCAQTQLYTDNISLTCHTPATCPLPVFAAWSVPNFCPNCTQLICQNCAVTNRSNCLICGTNSTILNGVCTCNTDCWPFTTPISTSTLGQWNGVSNSLTECRYNCTDQIDNCVFEKCTSPTFCTQCLVGFYLNVTMSTTNQNCISCTTITNCVQCTGPTACTLCLSGYYLNMGACTLCSSMITNCINCTSGTACTACNPGYDNLFTSCKCSPLLNSMVNCALCTVSTACSQCLNTTFFISTVDSMCHSCREFDSYCITCLADPMCSSCDIGYTVMVASATSQTCISCTTITKCVQCSDPLTCTLCVSGFIPQSGVCTQCRAVIFNCTTCTDALTCTSCDPGYLNVSSILCQCSPLLNSMANCALCTVSTACAQCVNTTFFISTVDSMCHSCREFDPYCSTCSAYQVCSSCDTGYTIVTFGATSLCQACWSLMSNCTLCSSPTACDVCNYTYGLTTSSTCQICSTLHMTGCEACTDSTACQFCVNQTYLVNGVCYTCDYIYKCDTCFVNALVQLECLTCLNRYFVQFSTLTGQQECKLCMHFTSYCQNCTNTVCLACLYPYLPGSDGLCSRCETGFYYISGICTNIAGCIRAAYLPNGTTTCLACAPELFFVFDSKLRKCVCIEGFQDFNSVGLLPECRAVCGDGIIVSQFEECDDKNTVSRDGCDQTCKKEPGFDCGFEQPSKCILELNVESFVFNYIFRVLGENKGIISYTIQPGHPGLEMRPWDKILKLNFPATAVNQSHLSYSYTAETGQLLVTVPYSEELEDIALETELTLDPSYIKSITPVVSLVSKLNGINAKLIFEHESELNTHKNINMITLILTVILLLVFYLGSYVHKMIGLETIQVIQAIYFVRMLAPSSSSSLLASLNSIQFSTSGYQNAQLIYGDTQQIQNNLNGCTTDSFTAINLHKFFLLNANFSLIPLILAIISYAVNMVRKYRSRNEYLKIKEPQQKDNFTKYQRSTQWVYDHFVFPYIMMFNLLSFFQCVSLISVPFETNLQALKKLETQSFIFHMFIVLFTAAIYCYEAINSFQEFSRYRMTEKERLRIPKSVVQKLEHDENNGDRPNYHPAYVLCHLVYYLVMSILMVVSVLVPTFTNSLELVMGVAVFYFLVICIWGPYHESVKAHNHFLKLYYGTFVAFLVICYLFVKLPKLTGSLYVAFMYVIMGLIVSIIIAGLARIIIQVRFRKALQNDNSMMKWNQESQPLQNKRKSSSEEQLISNINKPHISKRQQLIKKNNYTLEGQLNHMNKQLQKELPLAERQKLQFEGKSYLMNKIKQDIHKKKINLILQNCAQNAYQRGFERKTDVRLRMEIEPILQQKQADITLDVSNLAQQMIQSPKKQSILNQKSALQSLKQKLRTEWVYMHES